MFVVGGGGGGGNFSDGVNNQNRSFAIRRSNHNSKGGVRRELKHPL